MTILPQQRQLAQQSFSYSFLTMSTDHEPISRFCSAANESTTGRATEALCNSYEHEQSQFATDTETPFMVQIKCYRSRSSTTQGLAQSIQASMNASNIPRPERQISTWANLPVARAPATHMTTNGYMQKVNGLYLLLQLYPLQWTHQIRRGATTSFPLPCSRTGRVGIIQTNVDTEESIWDRRRTLSNIAS